MQIYGEEISSIFELLGRDELAMTKALGWVMHNCPEFLKRFAEEVDTPLDVNSTIVELEKTSTECGRTDIELSDNMCKHIVIEAKRGFVVPSIEQIRKYTMRSKVRALNSTIVIVAQDDARGQWLKSSLPQIPEINLKSISWQRIRILCAEAQKSGNSNHTRKRLLRSFDTFLKNRISMRDINSNMVKIFSLGKKEFFESAITNDGKSISFIDVVNRFNLYFHPIGGGSNFPKVPYNYVGFRYNSVLQSIHHVEGYSPFKNFSEHFSLNCSMDSGRDHWLYQLGENFKPKVEIRTNDPNKKYRSIVRSNSSEAHLDLLISSQSVAEAVHKTKKRIE